MLLVMLRSCKIDRARSLITGSVFVLIIGFYATHVHWNIPKEIILQFSIFYSYISQDVFIVALLYINTNACPSLIQYASIGPCALVPENQAARTSYDL